MRNRWTVLLMKTKSLKRAARVRISNVGASRDHVSIVLREVLRRTLAKLTVLEDSIVEVDAEVAWIRKFLRTKMNTWVGGARFYFWTPRNKRGELAGDFHMRDTGGRLRKIRDLCGTFFQFVDPDQEADKARVVSDAEKVVMELRRLIRSLSCAEQSIARSERILAACTPRTREGAGR